MTLRAFEKRRLIWPLGLGSTVRTRRYVSDLRPAASPARRKTGFKATLSLINDGSTAGEEMRLLLFCTFLVCLACWGFIANVGRNGFL